MRTIFQKTSYILSLIFQSRRRFNRTLNGDRSNIERALGRLKILRLKLLYMLRLDLVPSVIITACCIHNFKIDIDGIGQDDVELIGEEGEEGGRRLISPQRAI